MITTITDANFKTEVVESDKPVLIDFWAPWCNPCRIISPVIDEISTDVSYVKVGKVNVDENPELVKSFGIQSIPYLVVVNKGKPEAEITGVVPLPEILKMVEKYKQ